MNRLSEKIEKVVYVVLALSLCGLEAWRPFSNPMRHTITEVLGSCFALIVGFWLGGEFKTWGIARLGDYVEAAYRELAAEERAHREETESHEETIAILRAIATPADSLEEARQYLRVLDLERYEPDPEPEPEEESPNEGDVH